MPEYLSTKAIANRIKAKGLQKLRWYCQMCQKQCRDENGFKCHCMTEGHIRKMKLFSSNSGKVLSQFSSEFESTFINMLSRRHGTKRVHANIVYNEYIQDRHHVHMNATAWTSLTQFVQHLGKTGKCKVEETEKGWYISWIDRDPKALARQAARDKRAQEDRNDEDLQRREIKRMVRAARLRAEREGKCAEDAPKAFVRDGDEPVRIGALPLTKPKAASSSSAASRTQSKSARSAFDAAENETADNEKPDSTSKTSALHEIMAAGMQAAERRRAREASKMQTKSLTGKCWMAPGIVVKIVAKFLAGGKYHKQKGAVIRVDERALEATVRLFKIKEDVVIGQSNLETVIPKAGRRVLVVGGSSCIGSLGTLLGIHKSRFCASVRIDSTGNTIELEYEHVCKFDPEAAS